MSITRGPAPAVVARVVEALGLAIGRVIARAHPARLIMIAAIPSLVSMACVIRLEVERQVIL